MSENNLEKPFYLEQNEINEIIQYLMENGKVRDSLIFETLFKTGMRASELLSVQKRDITPGEKSKITVKNSKTKSGERDVLISRKLASRLRIYAENNGKKEYDRVFDMTRRNLYYIIHKWGEKILNKDIHPHTLRHSFAVHFLNETRNLVKLQRLLGHKNINHTQRYLRYTLEDTREEYVRAFEREE